MCTPYLRLEAALRLLLVGRPTGWAFRPQGRREIDQSTRFPNTYTPIVSVQKSESRFPVCTSTEASFPEVHESDELCLVAKARQEAEKSEPVLATEGVGFFRSV